MRVRHRLNCARVAVLFFEATRCRRKRRRQQTRVMVDSSTTATAQPPSLMGSRGGRAVECVAMSLHLQTRKTRLIADTLLGPTFVMFPQSGLGAWLNVFPNPV